ncbi:hypothetical protein D2E22_1684 [Bifidobacterium castoris]|uniref:Uncharacterized protein n=2 Tax=Bifidobacterium castoris TaxID=2306972 RepID=A0A430F555_9BIFI|nr:hypothetical protein D2E22_1684 [Bifidobacterium castoris]
MAESSMAASACTDEIRRDIMQDAIDCGEPDLAIIDALDIAGDDMQRLSHFPQQVRDLANDPEWPEFHRFRDTLNKVEFNN